MEYIRVTHLEAIREVNWKHKIFGAGYIDKMDAIGLHDLFDGAGIGEEYVLELVDMTEEEFNALPEFTGF